MGIHDGQGEQPSLKSPGDNPITVILMCTTMTVWAKFSTSDEISKQLSWSIRTNNRPPSVVWVDITGVQRYNAIRHRVFLQSRLLYYYLARSG
jgi:hypothetical protein